MSKAIAEFYHHKRPKRYIEPFLGGGSVFFEIRPENALLGDSNPELIHTFNQIKRGHASVERELRNLELSRSVYDQLRHSIPKELSKRAARFLFLNRTCFNGLYRTNQKGVFNVPFGNGERTPACILSNNVLGMASEILKTATLQCVDFEKLLSQSKKGDFVYCDPAYTVAHGSNGFVRYNERVFSWADQVRLKTAAVEASRRGVTVVVSNAAHESVKKLYHPFKPLEVERLSMISAKSGRGLRSEYLFVLSTLPYDRQRLNRSLIGHSLLVS